MKTMIVLRITAWAEHFTMIVLRFSGYDLHALWHPIAVYFGGC